MNFYKHHIGDYDADTSHLSWLEDMAYTRLMRLYYRREQPIPADIAQACRLVRATSKHERDAVESVLAEFFDLQEDGWHQKRCDTEIAAAEKKAEANRSNGLGGGRPRKDGGGSPPEPEPTKNPVGSQSQPTGNLPQTPDSRLQKNPLPPDGVGGVVHRLTPGFDAFWAAYPRKEAKRKAAQAFARLKPDDALQARMLRALEEQKRSEQWTRDGGKFIPHPPTWLNGGRWDDEPPASAADDMFAGNL